MREAGESPLLNRITTRDRSPPGLGTSPNSRLPGRSTGDEESTAHQRNDDRRESRFTRSRGCWPCELARPAGEKGRESGDGKRSKFRFSDLLGARLLSGSWLRPVSQDGADHPDHESDAHDDPDLAGREVPGKRSAGLIGPGPERLRENAGGLDREADQSHNLTGRTSHLLTLQGACNATHRTINSTRINRRVALTPQKDSDVGQFKSLAWFAREQGIGFGVVLEGFGLGVPRELAAHLQGDVPQVAGIGGAVGDLDVAGWQGTRLDDRAWACSR